MALIIEDGTIVAGADSWITVAEWESYLSAFGHTPSGTEAEKEVILRKAEKAISTRYTFDGDLVEQDQSTCLPRHWSKPINGFTISADTVPRDFKNAQAELAWSIHGGADPFADATSGALGPLVGNKSKAGPVEVEKTYGNGGSPFDPRSMSNYTATQDLLRPYLASGSSKHQIRMARG